MFLHEWLIDKVLDVLGDLCVLIREEISGISSSGGCGFAVSNPTGGTKIAADADVILTSYKSICICISIIIITLL